MKSDQLSALTLAQIGHAIGNAVSRLPLQQLAAAVPSEGLSDAGLALDDYVEKLLLLGVAAAHHAISSSDIQQDKRNELAGGLIRWIREQPTATSKTVLSNLERAEAEYVEAARQEADAVADLGGLSPIELAFAERLFCRGPESEARAHACAHLAIAAPKTLWPVASEVVRKMLAESTAEARQ